jgi:hypothetical protein
MVPVRVGFGPPPPPPPRVDRLSGFEAQCCPWHPPGDAHESLSAWMILRASALTSAGVAEVSGSARRSGDGPSALYLLQVVRSTRLPLPVARIRLAEVSGGHL